MKYRAIPAVLIIALAGCQQSEEQRLVSTATAAKNSIANHFKDPASVVFKDIYIDGQNEHICGEINAKNGYGGYTGFERFRATLTGTEDQAGIKKLRLFNEEVAQIDRKAGENPLYNPKRDLNKIVLDFACFDATPNNNPVKIPDTN